jgi:hypothetical protein
MALRTQPTALLDAIQCRDTVLPGYHYLGGRLGINAVAHQNGTVRFGTDPAASALDHIAGRLGASGLPEAQAEVQTLVTAHA